MTADPNRVAARLTEIAPDVAIAADLIFNICTDFRDGRRVEPLDPAALVPDPSIVKDHHADLEQLNEAIRNEYGRDLHELAEEEAWPLLDALVGSLANLARDSSKKEKAEVGSRLDELRQLTPGHPQR